jgi:menaquinone-9 beta-reductase
MPEAAFDIITVGGGLGGSAFAKAMADQGARVLLLERERQFSDRVRGEAIWPWGVAELKALGLFKQLSNTCGRSMSNIGLYVSGESPVQRDLQATTLQQVPALNWG